MQQTVTASEGLMLESVVSTRTGLLRLAIGLLQGVTLYLLYLAAKSDAWPATERLLFAPLLLVFLLAPVLLISSLGHLSGRKTAMWLLVSIAVIAALGFYDVWRGDTGNMLSRWDGEPMRVRYPSPSLVVLMSAGLFIAHSLLVSAAQDHRRIARYATHFETAWKLIIQLAFSALFVGVLWGALWLGASLFMLVKLDFLKVLLQQSWFAIPVTAFGFACAMHITDVRPAIVRGIRSLLLVLMSWILPVTTLIVVGFLLSLPLTGLQPLWATRSATAVLLGAAAALIILINAAYQNGHVAADVARVIRLSARLASLALLPIAAIAIYALSLRVGEYGWTTDRIIAAACLLIASCYALGYARAALQKATWLGAIATVNVAVAYVILAVLLAMLSPFADPARISVRDQVARLQTGLVAAERFDFNYLRFEGARYGQAALEQLKIQAQGANAALIRDKAQRALAQKYSGEPNQVMTTAADVATNLTVWPKQSQLPASFAKQDWSTYKRSWELPFCLTQLHRTCDAFMIDVTGDNKQEILLIASDRMQQGVVMAEQADSTWSVLGNLPRELSGCDALRQKMIAGEYQPVPSQIKDLELAGQRIEIRRSSEIAKIECPASKK